jgi:YD repeat-containing protein
MNPSPPATPPAAPQVLPPPWLRPWSVEWRAPGATRLHRRVRWTVYLAFLVMAAALLLQAAVHVQGEQARSGEAALLDMAGLQRTFSQQMAWRAARLALAETQIQTQTQTQTQTDNDAFAADDRSEQAVALERLLNTSMQEALQFEALVAQQLKTAGAAQAALAAALDDWLAVRERLWYRGGALLHHVRAATSPGDAAPPVAAAAVAVQLEAERALQAAQLLSDRLRALAEHRGQRQRADLQLWAAGLLVLLGLLALAVVEPTVRRVRRQLGLLQAQALSLKQLALVTERTRAMVLITDAQGGVKRLQWSRLGLLTQYTDCSGHSTVYRYDARGRLLEVTDAQGHSLRYERDRTGQVQAVHHPDGSQTHYQWSTQGRLFKETNAQGQTADALVLRAALPLPLTT